MSSSCSALRSLAIRVSALSLSPLVLLSALVSVPAIPAANAQTVSGAVSPVLTIGTEAGNGTAGFSGDGAPAGNAEMNGPTVVVLDSAGNLYIADRYNNRVRKVMAATGIITTIVGNGTPGYSGDGGPAVSAELSQVTSVTLDSMGNLYIADFGNNRIRKVDTAGIITTVAGNGTSGYSGDGGPATSAEMKKPAGVALDKADNL